MNLTTCMHLEPDHVFLVKGQIIQVHLGKSIGWFGKKSFNFDIGTHDIGIFRDTSP